ncbi:efflux RND transporter periplasmic adaptor subunit [Terriglobus albidus]|uniref:Efflux RND transporter periplasmic adaptor subunit n=2 Tax=Terriglobus albidus TaxID=1592106 RepID=A0A5B9EI57_9BACT|nr:efflux RND transporter periplasmic adaptor subunit [Terriglobus albidus]
MRISIGILSFVVFSVLAGCAKTQKAGPEPVPVVMEMVATQQVQPSWTYSGEIRPDTEVQLAFKQPGYIAALYRVKGVDDRMRDLQVGDEIPVGATLARLRSSDYEASFNSAVGQQRSAQGTLEASQAELNRAKADQVKADFDFERAQALYAAKAMTRPDYDAAVDQHTSATANLEAAVRQIEARSGQVTAAAAQAVSARINLSDTSLNAPMPGVIVEKSVEAGSLVAAGTRAFTLDDTRVVKVNFGIPDSMLAHLKLGTQVPVQVDALQARTFTGQITGISASANRESRVFNIEVSLPNRDRSLKVGMIARIRIAQANPQAVPVVPLTALMTAESGSNNYSVFTVSERGGKQFAQLKSVRVGETFGKSVVIDEGLTPGERIIVNRTNQLSDGSLIRIANQETQQ